MRNHDVNGVEAYTPTETGLHDTLTIMFAPTNGFWVFPVSEKHRLAATVLSVAKFGNIGFWNAMINNSLVVGLRANFRTIRRCLHGCDTHIT